jgi:23S rRNA-/tRNA-specific pseudouridylate synthase
LVIVSRAPTAHRGLQHAFEQRTVKKTYSFATRKIAGFSEYIVDRRIALDPLHPVLRTTSTTDGQHASTVLSFSHHDHSEGHEISVVHAQPISGRTHQIRVHAASQGMSIIGDNFYGGLPASYLHLVSRSIDILHPVTNQPLKLHAPRELLPPWVAYDDSVLQS